MAKRIDMVGKRFNRWAVISYAFSKKTKCLTIPMWKCRCSCGTIKVISGATLRNGTSKSCGCYKREKIRLRYGEASFNSVYNKYKTRAYEASRTFLLSKEDFRNVTSQSCYYCGVKPSQYLNPSSNYGGYIYNGIDRIDNARGYEPDNIVPCCGTCNCMKRDMAVDEFFEHINKIQNIHIREK